jgi:two-component system sensor histidine kinase/response regulator
LEKFKKNKYEIILMDMQMPEMGGLTATQKIREFENGNSHIPILAMTANAMPGDSELCLASGMDHYLSKPIKTQQLKDLLSHFSEQSSLRLTSVEIDSGIVPARRISDGDGDGVGAGRAFDYHTALLTADAEILEIMIPLFLADSERQRQELADAISQEDFKALYRCGHTLKGLVGSFNAAPVEELASALEQKGRNADLDRIDLIFSELSIQLSMMNTALAQFLIKGCL